MKHAPHLRHLLLLLVLGFGAGIATTAQLGYRATIDTRSLDADRLLVTVELPPIQTDTAVFVFPITVPGTYETHLWWRLVSDLQAFDASGSPLPVTRSADSQFVLLKARQTRRITYRLDDSFDDTDDRVSIFNPAGTSFQGDSMFVFNHGGMLGYVEGYQRLPYSVAVSHPAALYLSTALEVVSRTESTQYVTSTYQAPTFDAIVDGPAILCRPDTASFSVAGVDVHVALMHGRSTLVAPTYAKALEAVTAAIGRFLPRMPVDRYAFLMYLWDGDTTEVKGAGMGQGALEHSYSSFYFWRYGSKPFGLDGIAAHEFLHILVPLNVHSREIEEFNFRSPAMSGHLWLYEGVTEYFADQALLRGGKRKEASHIRTIESHASSVRQLPDTFSLYDFSRDVLSDENQELYPLIYQVGPLNALLMDILLRESTSGRMGMLELVYALMDRYGPSKPFNDEDLFGVITELSSPAVGEYCRRYIAGREAFPMADYLPRIGLQYQDSVPTTELSYGIRFNWRAMREESVPVSPTGSNPLKLERGDALVAINGTPLGDVDRGVFREILNPEDREASLTLTVLRDGASVDLQGSPVDMTIYKRHVVTDMKELTYEQRRLRNLVFYGNEDGRKAPSSTTPTSDTNR